MTLTGMTRDERRAYLRGLLSRKARLRVPDEDEAGLPTAYCRQDRDYMNYQTDCVAAPRDTFRDHE